MSEGGIEEGHRWDSLEGRGMAAVMRSSVTGPYARSMGRIQIRGDLADLEGDCVCAVEDLSQDVCHKLGLVILLTLSYSQSQMSHARRSMVAWMHEEACVRMRM